MTVLLAIVALAAIGWILLPLLAKGRDGGAAVTAEERDRADAVEMTRGAIEELETDHAEGKIDPVAYEKAKTELTERLAALGRGGRSKRAGQ